MAERRMFAKTIIDSDAFLDMPLSAQALYFHLSMRADDEGFVNNPKKIQRMIGGSDDDLKLLCAKNFIIPFESGIVVIKHWRIHNYIRADRLISTKYQDERNQLEIKDNGAYTISSSLIELDNMDASDKRKTAYKDSSLPYSFTYKIRRAFNGKMCPVCGRKMIPSCKQSMPTIQHNTPISKGGKHELDNISVICESCNTSIRDKETDALNNAEVMEMWDRIIIAEKSNLDWFRDPEILESLDVSQMTVTCQSDVSIGKDRLGKDRLGKDSKGENSKGKDIKPPLPPLPGEGGCNTTQRRKKQSEVVNERFERFWSSYPRKQSKINARKAFEKISPSEELLGKMLSAIEEASKSYQWTKDGGQFIPLPATWLNQGRWEDEFPTNPEPALKGSSGGIDWWERSRQLEEEEKLNAEIGGCENPGAS